MEEFASLRFEAINGIVALRRRERKGVPRKRPEEFVEIAKRLRGKVDILLHDSPKLPLPECSFIADDGGAEAVDVAIYEVKLRLVLCRHLHMSSYTIYRYEYGTLYVRIDSS